MRRQWALCVLMAVLSVSALAQRRPDVKPTVQGILFLPVALGNPIFDNLTAVLGQVEGSFQLPVYKGFGAGVGVNATWYELNEFGLSSQVPTDGDVRRMLYFAKLNWTRYTGNSTFLEFSTKLGQSTWAWNCRSCTENERQSGFHWGLNAAWSVHATDNLAFGLSLGYEQDATRFSPGVIGLDRFPGRTDTGAPYHFLTVGLGFSTSFRKLKDEVW
ncbi:MAG: hypothetical protein IPP95_02335 [Flavobacteriales bacterium]|nr:MAG: hypothetical protein IPP95_02335 [Flavobacteriales bacterium]HQY79381.1 hypothetical protein [Flavobacteriales bacterium]